MALWCRDFPTVSVPQGAEPKPFTLILPYYENPRFLRQQIGWWDTYPQTLKSAIAAIIVDDGSPNAPALDVINESSRGV
jgi:hypothetical protein